MLHLAVPCVLLLEAVKCYFMPDDYKKFVKKAVAGDKEAFGRLYQIFLDRIYRFTYYLTRDEFAAEDITQNTFLKAWNNLPNFSTDRGTFQSYLFTIARNLVIDAQRKKKEYSLEEGYGADAETGENLEEKVWKDEAMQRVHEAIADLDEFDRQIVILRFFEEMHFDEMAEILGKEPGTIRVKIHRIMEKLRNKLEGTI